MRLKNIFAKRALNRTVEQLAIFALGIIAGFLLLSFERFEFKWEFNVINFFAILLTFVFTFLLQHALSGRTSDDRVEKDIIIEHARKLGERLVHIGNLCRESITGTLDKTERRSVLPEFKALNADLHAINILLELSPIRLEQSRFQKIQRECVWFKRCVTGGLFPSGPLTAKEYSTIQSALKIATSEVYRLIFYVNRL